MCVSFDTSGNPTLQIQWQVSTNVIPIYRKYHVNVHICRGTEMMNRIAYDVILIIMPYPNVKTIQAPTHAYILYNDKIYLYL